MVGKVTKGTTTVDVHARPESIDGTVSRADQTPHIDVTRLPLPPGHAQRPSETPGQHDLDAIAMVPAVTISAGSAAQPVTQLSGSPYRPLKAYKSTGAQLPVPDADGLRMFKGRLFVDTIDGTLHIGLDRRDGFYRAKLIGEQDPSGPVLLQDPDSKHWFALDHDVAPIVRLSPTSLRPFRTQLDFTGASRDSDGLYEFESKRYAVIEGHAYQALQDPDASSPTRKVWRIVNAKDPVASGGDNIYHASRAGETLAITAGDGDSWVASVHGLLGGMPRSTAKQDNVTLLLQRYEPVKQANDALVVSNERFNQLRDHAYRQPAGSAAETAAWVALEVHVRRHIRMQNDFVKMYVEHKDWLIYLKAGGLYKKELFEQQMLRVDYLDKLMAIMDSRASSDIDQPTLESSKKKLALLNRKLDILKDRQEVLDQIKKTFRDADDDIATLTKGVPDAEMININKFHCYLHLLTGNMDEVPIIGMPTMMALRSMQDLKSAPGLINPIALRFFLERISMDKQRFKTLLATESPERLQYIKEILPLLDSFEASLERQLTEFYRTFENNTQLPGFDQDIDFDFLPEQPKDSPPVTPRKVFRTREHGAYTVLVGEKQTADDGSVTLIVPNAYKSGEPPQRYEKREGEWRQVPRSIPTVSKPQLVGDATLFLGQIDEYVQTARLQEAQKDNPTNIIEFLAAKADRLDELGRQLKTTQGAELDADVTALIAHLTTASARLTSEGQSILVRMYKNRDVLDILRLNYLLDRGELTVTRSVERKPMGKGQNKSFLDVYAIGDRVSATALWEAHFHYDKKDSPALNFTVRGGHLKTLDQAGRGAASQRRDEQAGLPHVAIWRETFDGKTARKIFDLAA